MYDKIFTLYYKNKQDFSIKINNICCKKAVKRFYYVTIIMYAITAIFVISIDSIIIANSICDKYFNNYRIFEYSAIIICPVAVIIILDR